MNHLPRPSALTPIAKSAKGKVDIKPSITRALDNESVNGLIAPLLTNGVVNGHKLFDIGAVLDIIVKFDAKHGGNLIEDSMLNRMEKVSQVVVCLRRFYAVDKKWKVTGVNPKRFTELAAPTQADPL